MKRVYIAMNPTDAHLLKGALESEGIEAVVQGEFLWIARGEVPITTDTAPSVWVIDETDYERATEIVKAFQSSEGMSDPENEEWKCDNCNEINEGQFTECWNCCKDYPNGH
jgi:hypothetical protein